MRTEDLRRQLADIADTLPIPPQDPVAAVRSRIRHRHRRRTLTRSAIVAVIVLAALGGTLVVFGSHTHTSQHVLTGPGTSASRPPSDTGSSVSPASQASPLDAWARLRRPL